MFQHGRLVRPFLCGPCAAGRPPADFRLIRRQKGCVPSRARLSPSCVLYPDMIYGFPTGRTLMGRSTLSSVRSLHSRPLSFPFRRRGILSHVSTYHGRSVRYCHTFQRPGHIRRYVTSRDRGMPGQKKRSLRARLSPFCNLSRRPLAGARCLVFDRSIRDRCHFLFDAVGYCRMYQPTTAVPYDTVTLFNVPATFVAT